MESETFNFITTILQAITASSIFVAAIGLAMNRRSGHYSIMVTCMENYRKIMREIQSEDSASCKNKLICKRDLLGLFNEQLFYLKNHAVPEEIKKEWIETMSKCLNDKFSGPFKSMQGITFDDSDIENFRRVKDFKTDLDKEIGSSKKPLTAEIVETLYKKWFKRKWYSVF